MRMLDRHVLTAVVTTSVAAVSFFGVLFLGGNALNDLATYVSEGQLTLPAAGKLVLLLIPFVATYALPMGILTGVLLAFGRLAADHEITAMRAAGIGYGRIALPVLVLGVLGAWLELGVNTRYMPWARAAYHREFDAALRMDPTSLIVPQTFVRDFPRILLYVEAREGAELRDIWLWQLDENKRVVRLVRATRGRLIIDENANQLVVTMSDVSTQNSARGGAENFARESYVAFASTFSWSVSLHDVFGPPKLRQKPAYMTPPELRAAMRQVDELPDLDAATRTQRRMALHLELQGRYVAAASVLAFTILGIPLGIKTRRKETSANLGIALAIVLGYYSSTLAVAWLADRPDLRPDLLCWLPVLTVAGVGAWLLHRR